jgi:hypothetical protein
MLEVQDNLHIRLQNKFSKAELIRHLPVNKYEPLPSEDNILQNMNSFKQMKTVHCPLKYPLNALSTSETYTIENSRSLFLKIERNQLHMIDL